MSMIFNKQGKHVLIEQNSVLQKQITYTAMAYYSIFPMAKNFTFHSQLLTMHHLPTNGCTPPQKLTSSSYRQKRENDKYRWKCICSIIGLQHARSKVEWHCPLTPSFVAVLWWCPLLVLGTVLWCCLLIYPVLDGVLWCCACHCQLSLTLSACSKSPSASVTAWRFTSIVCQVWEALCCHGNTSNAVKGCKYFLEKLSSALLPFSRHPLQFLLPWL